MIFTDKPMELNKAIWVDTCLFLVSRGPQDPYRRGECNGPPLEHLADSHKKDPLRTPSANAARTTEE
jgi:hypothetical protein